MLIVFITTATSHPLSLYDINCRLGLVTGDRSADGVTGDRSAGVVITGDRSAGVVTGDRSASAVTGDRSACVVTVNQVTTKWWLFARN